MTEQLNATSVKTTAELAVIINRLGFASETVDSPIKREAALGDADAEDVACLWLDAVANNFQDHVVVAVENEAFCVYFIDRIAYLYKRGVSRRGEITEVALRDLIMQAAYIP